MFSIPLLSYQCAQDLRVSEREREGGREAPAVAAALLSMYDAIGGSSALRFEFAMLPFCGAPVFERPV